MNDDAPNAGLLRDLPQIGRVLESDPFVHLEARVPRSRLKHLLRGVLDELRDEILSGRVTAIPSFEQLSTRVERGLETLRSYRRVINATGVVLHTGLGRAPLSDRATRALADGATGAVRLELDLESGKRGGRDAGCREKLVALTGAEDATVVNNNAGATLLAVAALGRGRDVIVSRGELVEIGGSYRLPTIIEESGAHMREVGTTNRTHLADYENATSENTGAYLKVHTSNYAVVGFSREVRLEELIALGREHGVPTIHDVGSGHLDTGRPLPDPVAEIEPALGESIALGADLVLASGDKLIGGPQAGLIIGTHNAVERCRKHPLFRALRPGRLIYSALEATLESYMEGCARDEIPTLEKLHREPAALEESARRLADRLEELDGIETRIVEVGSAVGSGAGAAREIPSFGVEVDAQGLSAREFEERLRHARVPVVGRVRDGAFTIDVRSLSGDDAERLVESVREQTSGGREDA